MRGLFNESDAFVRMGNASQPFAQAGQVGCRPVDGGQDGEHVVDSQAAYRRSS
jgi:hypothetical protein